MDNKVPCSCLLCNIAYARISTGWVSAGVGYVSEILTLIYQNFDLNDQLF